MNLPYPLMQSRDPDTDAAKIVLGALMPEEINKLLENCADGGDAVVTLAILSGLRRGEIFGLQ